MKEELPKPKTEEALEELISRPSPELVQTMEKLPGDIIFLGVSGKMGVSMARMAKRACEAANSSRRIIGVSRFSNPDNKAFLKEMGIETLAGDLLNNNFVRGLPEVENVVYLAGTKFGTQGKEAYTWAMNAYLPGLIAERYRKSRIVALSTGCVYPLVDVESGGSLETDLPIPVGEYAQSCLGRERLFAYGSEIHGTPVSLIRLNYSVEMRYGVLVDIACQVARDESIDVSMGYANVIWQGDANDLILRAFKHASSPVRIINVTGSEVLSIREVANRFGKLLNRDVHFVGEESKTALLSNASWMVENIGKPRVSLDQVIEWTAEWIKAGNPILGKPTHFEVRDGKY